MSVNAIRDYLVLNLREELSSCPDGIIHAADLKKVDVDWDSTTRDGLLIKSDQGSYRVAISVTAIEV